MNGETGIWNIVLGLIFLVEDVDLEFTHGTIVTQVP